MKKNATLWDREYEAAGIPSSFRTEPSGVLLWTIENWRFLSDTSGPQTALDVGCGTGRNSFYLGAKGASVRAFDVSPRAIALAKRRLKTIGIEDRVTFSVHDLDDGLPGEDGSYDLVTDIFVYKHQMKREVRQEYRRELGRVLAPHGVLLLSLAGVDDGYYGQCPDAAEDDYGARAIVDPAVGVGSVLFTLESLRHEMSDLFRLEMAWHKVKDGQMHNQTYRRSTIATLWRLNI